MVSLFPFIAWAMVIVVGIVIYIGVASVIEKSGMKRLGATGKLFTCDPDKVKNAD